jgi:glutamate--cysteine ligase
LNVRLGSLSPELNTPLTLHPPGHQALTLEPLQRTPRRLGLKYFDPCTVLLNTDLNAGVPGMLEDLHEQYLLPPLHAAWPTRRHSRHYAIYEELAKRFAKMLGMDVWLIHPSNSACTGVNLTTAAGMEHLQTQVDAVLAKTRRKYKEYGINEKPFVLIKTNQGPADRGQVLVRDARELPDLVAHFPWPDASDLLIQEGVHTQERIGDAVAEPQVYLMDRYVVGGFYRVQTASASPNAAHAASPSNHFVPLAFDQSAQLPQPGMPPGASAPNRFYMYGVIARLAILAASYELEATDPDAEIYD